MEKMDNMQEHMASVSIEMKTVRKNLKEVLQLKYTVT